MKTLAQDSQNDIIIALGDFATVGGVDACAVIIADAVRTVTGELQLDTERGVPYFETVFKSVNGIDIWKSDVRRRILSFSFVKSIDSFDVSYMDKRLYYTISITTDGGTVTVTS